MKNPNIAKAIVILKIRPTKNPRIVPKAGFIAPKNSFPERISPKNAPMRDPNTIPIGPKIKIPRVIPIVAPIKPYLVALYFFAPTRGAKKSKIIEQITSNKNIIAWLNDIFSKFPAQP